MYLEENGNRKTDFKVDKIMAFEVVIKEVIEIES